MGVILRKNVHRTALYSLLRLHQIKKTRKIQFQNKELFFIQEIFYLAILLYKLTA